MGGSNLGGELLSDAGNTPLPTDPAELSKLTDERGVNYISAQSLNQAGFRVDPANPRHATNPEGFSVYRDEYGWGIAEDYIRMRPAVATWTGLVGGALPPDTWTGIDAGAFNIKPHALPVAALPDDTRTAGFFSSFRGFMVGRGKWVAATAGTAIVVGAVGAYSCTDNWFSSKSENVNGSASQSLAAVPAVSLAPTATSTVVPTATSTPVPTSTPTEVPPPAPVAPVQPVAPVVQQPAVQPPPPTATPTLPPPPPTATPVTTKEVTFTMNGTVGEVPPSGCDGNTKTGSPFGPLIYTLRIMGNQATLINAAGSSAGAVVATGTINGNSLTLSNNGPLPASGLRFASFNGTVNGNTISGSGTFQGSQQPCVIPFDFTANTNAPVS